MNAAQSSLLLSLLATLAGSALAQDVQPRMGASAPGLAASEVTRFQAGKLIFDKAFGPLEGRGPGFNDGACNGCHLFPASGGSSTKAVTRFGIAATATTAFDDLGNLGGSLLQAEANDPVNCLETVPAQATAVGTRITPPCWGFGLIEAIPDAAIVANETNPPAGVSGRVHWVPLLENPSGPLRAGRFGWKAQVATVLTFSGDASLNEMGLTNRLVPTENAPNGDLVKLAMCDLTPDPEDGPDAQGFDAIDRMTDFQRYLAAPPQTPKSGMTGETLFNQIGCAKCHVPSFVTGPAAEPALANKSIRVYTDFLLHDIGTGDGIVQGDAQGEEFRTPPLWGLLARVTNGLLHDARISGGTIDQHLDDVIAAHGVVPSGHLNPGQVEGAQSAAAYLALSAQNKTHVRNFLLSLGQMEFDFERDFDIDGFDWFFIQPSITGPSPSFTADDSNAINDVDQDGDFDLRDIGAFQRGFTDQ